MAELVILAAGRGSRFGGMKQLAPVGPNGEAILDILLARAAKAGFGRAVVVIGAKSGDAVREHLTHAPLPLEFALQAKPMGTAHAVLAGRDALEGSFAVLNADDLYPDDAFAALFAHLGDGGDEHALVAFDVEKTLIGDQPVTRASIDAPHGRLVRITEGTVARGHQPRGLVSMNMWGFRPSILDVLAREVDAFDGEGELLLPDVVARYVDAGGTVRVLHSTGRCIGITHREDEATVRAELGR